MQHIIKLTGVKEKNPKLQLKKGDTFVDLPNNTVTLKVTGVQFKEEKYQDQPEVYKLKLRGTITTSSGSEQKVLLDMGSSILAKGMANCLLTASSLDNIRIQVYKTKTGTYGASVRDLTIADDGAPGVNNSQVLKWDIAGEDREKLISHVTIKGKDVADDTEFCLELQKKLTQKYGETHPFVSAQDTQLDDSLFSDELQQNKKTEELTIEEIPF